MSAPNRLELLGVLPQLISDPLVGLTQIAHQYSGQVVTLPLGPLRVYMPTSPQQIAEVLIDKWRSFPKGQGGMWKQIRRLFGDSLVTLDGEPWIRDRRLLQALFSRQNLDALTGELINSIASALDALEPRVAGGQPVAINREIALLTEQVALRTLFGVSPSRPEMEALRSALLDAFDMTMQRMLLFFIPQELPLPGELAFRRGLRRLDDGLLSLLRNRRGEVGLRNDLLSLLLAARDEQTGQPLLDKQIRDELVTMFFASHDSTSLATTWALYLLCQHPQVLEKVCAEVDAVLGQRLPTSADVPQLQYIKQVLLETLRLYPSGWLMPRSCPASAVLDGYNVSADSVLLINIFALHRDPSLWERPETFVPERFAAGLSQFPRGMYIPFGAGPRLCIGDQFGLMQMQLSLAMFLQRFRPRLVQSAPVPPVGLGGSLRPKTDLMMFCSARTSSQPALRAEPPPLVSGLPGLGLIPRLLVDPLQTMSDVIRSHGRAVRLQIGPTQCYLFATPDHARHILEENSKIYTKESSLWEAAQTLVGKGIGNTDGELWLKNRRAIQPQFHRSRVHDLVRIMTDEVRRLLDELHAQATAGPLTIPLFKEIRRMVSVVFLRTMFNASINDPDMEVLLRSIKDSFASVDTLLWLSFLPRFIPTPGMKKYRAAVAALDDIVYRILDERVAQRQKQPQQESPGTDDLLNLLLQAFDPQPGDSATRLQLRDEIMTMIIATQDGPALMLGWALALLAQNPDADRAIRRELATVLGDNPVRAESLPALTYTRGVLEESLRLYTPLWLTVRLCTQDDVIDGWRIPKGSLVFLSPHLIHHDPEVWPSPERFDPTRFTPEGTRSTHRGAYLPFGIGPHQCIGKHIGLMFGQIFLAEFLQRFRIRLPAHTRIIPKAAVSLQPKHEVFALLEPRTEHP